MRPSTTARPPIVMLVFDEFSTTALVDGHGHIDAARYPNFAALAGDATWFPYATASLDETGRAMRALLTGRNTWRFAKPTYANEPRNLFTLLGRRYRLNASEEATAMCPRRLCPHARKLTRRQVLHKLASGRPERLERWLRSVRPQARPTFHYKHVLLPHGPWRYLPSGHQVEEARTRPRLSWRLEHFNPWLIRQTYQRHLLQVGFTDRLLGRVLDHLRAMHLYDEALVVVTADNGEGFGRPGNGHEISRRSAVDIALTPLFVKLPRQRRGRTVARHVRTIDVLPTVARAVHLRVPWRIAGHAVFGRSARRIPRSTLLVKRSGQRLTLSGGALRRAAAGSRRLKLKLFGSGDGPPGLFGIGPYRELQGSPLGRWRPLPRGGVRAVLDSPERYARVRLSSGLVPAKVTGRLLGARSAGPMDLAIAVNGQIAATAPSFRARGRRIFSALVPDSAVREGANVVQVFAILPGAGGPRLRPL